MLKSIQNPIDLHSPVNKSSLVKKKKINLLLCIVSIDICQIGLGEI